MNNINLRWVTNITTDPQMAFPSFDYYESLRLYNEFLKDKYNRFIGVYKYETNCDQSV
ncbi:hypothetical protein ELBI_87 [Anabaena phage Elbi]|nr:hypothetical protein ELBI_87 [Anabaena phage Elbi]